MDFSDNACPELLKLYTRERWLGSGGEGVVYQVKDRQTQEYSAAKMFSEERKALREESMMMKLRYCPGTAQVERLVKENEGGCYGSLVMKLYGDNLGESNLNTLCEKDVAVIVKKLAETLQLIHARGVVHRDLKLENVFLERNFQKMSDVVIGDFGLAADGKGELRHYIGTPDYMSPEVYELRWLKKGTTPPNNYTPAVDIWGLGIIAYQLLGGKMDVGVRDRGAFHCPAGVSRNAWDFVLSMLARDPKKRITLDALLKHRWIVEYTTTQKHETGHRKRCSGIRQKAMKLLSV